MTYKCMHLYRIIENQWDHVGGWALKCKLRYLQYKWYDKINERNAHIYIYMCVCVCVYKHTYIYTHTYAIPMYT